MTFISKYIKIKIVRSARFAPRLSYTCISIGSACVFATFSHRFIVFV